MNNNYTPNCVLCVTKVRAMSNTTSERCQVRCYFCFCPSRNDFLHTSTHCSIVASFDFFSSFIPHQTHNWECMHWKSEWNGNHYSHHLLFPSLHNYWTEQDDPNFMQTRLDCYISNECNIRNWRQASNFVKYRLELAKVHDATFSHGTTLQLIQLLLIFFVQFEKEPMSYLNLLTPWSKIRDRSF